jgi:hypothetical protein
MPSFAANIPQLPEDEIQVESVIPKEVPVAGKRPNPRFTDLKFGSEYDISEDTGEATGFFKRKK